MATPRRRFSIEAVVAAVSGVLAVITLFWRDWPEVTGSDPDRHDGSVEWLLVLVLAELSLTLHPATSLEWRAGAAPRESRPTVTGSGVARCSGRGGRRGERRAGSHEGHLRRRSAGQRWSGALAARPGPRTQVGGRLQPVSEHAVRPPGRSTARPSAEPRVRSARLLTCPPRAF